MTTKKKPQDRLPKAPKITRPQDTPGYELLKPIEEVPIWDQAPILALISQLTDRADGEGKLSLNNSEAVNLIGEMGRAMLPFAVDVKEYTKFASGKAALQDIMNLGMAWTASLGEDESSDDS